MTGSWGRAVLAAMCLLVLAGCTGSREVDSPDPRAGDALDAPQPALPGASARMSQGPAAVAGYFYSIELSGFAPSSAVTVVCRDSVDPHGFRTVMLAVDANGTVVSQDSCYSGDGEEYWVYC
jgi:hypothetical protein